MQIFSGPAGVSINFSVW